MSLWVQAHWGLSRPLLSGSEDADRQTRIQPLIVPKYQVQQFSRSCLPTCGEENPEGATAEKVLSVREGTSVSEEAHTNGKGNLYGDQRATWTSLPSDPEVHEFTIRRPSTSSRSQSLIVTVP